MRRSVRFGCDPKSSIVATSQPGGICQINGVTAPRVASRMLYTDGLYINIAPFTRPIIAQNGVILQNGTNTVPSLSFSSDFATGLYRSAPGEMTFVIGAMPGLRITGDKTYVASTITTFGGADLKLNPGGPNIDFSGKNLINVGAVVTDPNKIAISSGTPVNTVDDTPTTIMSLATSTDATYSFDAVISCISLFDNTSSGSIKMFAKGKNIGGTVTVSDTAVHLVTIADPALLNGPNDPRISASLNAAGTMINITVTGILGIPLRWYGTGEATRVLL